VSTRASADQAASLGEAGFVEPDERYPFFRLREDRGIQSPEDVTVEIEFTPVGISTFWPSALQCEPGPGLRMYKFCDTLHKKVIDCCGRILYKMFV